MPDLETLPVDGLPRHLWPKPLNPARLVQKDLDDYDQSTNSMAGVCEICGFNRVVEQAHIVPARFNGPKVGFNLLSLCPNHHTLFDRDMLTHEEFSAIEAKVSAALAVHANAPLVKEWRDSIIARYGINRSLLQ